MDPERLNPQGTSTPFLPPVHTVSLGFTCLAPTPFLLRGRTASLHFPLGLGPRLVCKAVVGVFCPRRRHSLLSSPALPSSAVSSRKQTAGRGRAAWAESSSLRQQGEQPSRAVFGEAGRGWVEIYMNKRARFYSLSRLRCSD